MRALLPLALFAATVCYGLGLVLPLIRVQKLFLFTDEPSLVAMIAGLWGSGDIALAILVALFSVVFPLAKLGLLHVAAYGGPDGHRMVPSWFRILSNWSMLDVVLVALVVFAAKTTGLAEAFARPGLWFFAASVVLTAGASALVKRQA
jgi:paraquat-inducible protein A